MSSITLENLLALSPLIITATTAVMVMLAIAFKRHHFFNATLTVIGLNVALISVFWIAQNGSLPQYATEVLVVDMYSLFYIALILICALACVTLTYNYVDSHPGNREEIYLLLLLSTCGAIVLATSTHFAGLFIGLELLSVPLFGLVGYSFQRERSMEASAKYLILSAFSTAFMLFGMALLYAQTGDLSYGAIHKALADADGIPMIAWAGAALIFVGLGFKLSLVPFHLWTPDVYEGSPAPVGAYLATVSKIAVFAAFLRLVQELPLMNFGAMTHVLVLVALLSIIGGNLLALMQTNVKRMLGYSSVAHFGYLLIAVIANLRLEEPTVAIYLVTYAVTNIVAFGVLVQLSSPYKGADADTLAHLRGLFWSRPILAAVMTVAMLSMAGIPLTAGFIGKFHLMLIGVGAREWLLLGALVVGSAIGLYYYLRLMVTLYMASPGMRRHDAPMNWGRTTGGIMLILAAILVVVMGVLPEQLIQAAMSVPMK